MTGFTLPKDTQHWIATATDAELELRYAMALDRIVTVTVGELEAIAQEMQYRSAEDSRLASWGTDE